MTTVVAKATATKLVIMVVAVFCIVIYVITRKNIKQSRGKGGEGQFSWFTQMQKKSFCRRSEQSTHFIQHFYCNIWFICAEMRERERGSSQNDNSQKKMEERRKKEDFKRWLDLINPALFCVFVRSFVTLIRWVLVESFLFLGYM